MPKWVKRFKDRKGNYVRITNWSDKGNKRSGQVRYVYNYDGGKWKKLTTKRTTYWKQ